MLGGQAACPEWDLPQEIVSQILLKLGGKEGARCGCVSNSWRASTREPSVHVHIALVKRWHVGLVEPVDLPLQTSWPRFVAHHNDTFASIWFAWIRVWSLDQDVPPLDAQVTSTPTCLCFVHGGARLVVGDEDGSLHVWDLTLNQMRPRMHAHVGEILDIAESGAKLATASADAKIKIWDTNSWSCVGTFHSPCTLGCFFLTCCIAFVAREEYLLCGGSEDGTIFMRRIPGGDCFGQLDQRTSGITSLSVRGHMVAVVTSEVGVRLWDASTSVCLVAFECPGVACVDLQDEFIMIGEADGKIRLWDNVSYKCIRSLQVGGGLRKAWVAGRKVVALSRSGSIRVWDFSL